MTARILDGKALAADMRAEMKLEVARLKQEHDLVPGLAVVLVGDDPASVSYVKGKQKACGELGVYSRELKFDADLSEEELLRVVSQLNGDDEIHGILVQLSLPEGLDEDRVLNAINPDKDVDGLHPVNLGRLGETLAARGQHYRE